MIGVDPADEGNHVLGAIDALPNKVVGPIVVRQMAIDAFNAPVDPGEEPDFVLLVHGMTQVAKGRPGSLIEQAVRDKGYCCQCQEGGRADKIFLQGHLNHNMPGENERYSPHEICPSVLPMGKICSRSLHLFKHTIRPVRPVNSSLAVIMVFKKMIHLT